MTDPTADLVAIQRTGGVATLRLKRPKALNALDPEMLAALDRALDAVESDEAVRAVVDHRNGRTRLLGRGRHRGHGGDGPDRRP